MGDADRIGIRISTDISMQDRGDHWAARIDPLCIIGYGDTKKAAHDRVNWMLSTGINILSDQGGLDAVKSYLDGRGAKYEIFEPSGSYQHVELPILVGAGA